MLNKYVAIFYGCVLSTLICILCVQSVLCSAWQVVNLKEECNYSSTMYITSVEGEIRFRMNRGKKINCVATLQVPSNMKMSIEFIEFYLHASDPTHCDDTWVKLYDGPLAMGGKDLTPPRGLCGDDDSGTRLPARMYTSGNSFTMWLGRTTTRSGGSMEFRLSFLLFKTYSDGKCFLCENTSIEMCIDSSLACDHRDTHCPDGSDEDEQMCYYADDSTEDTSTYEMGMRIANIIGITVGVVIFFLVVILIVTCCCRTTTPTIPQPAYPHRAVTFANDNSEISPCMSSRPPTMQQASVRIVERPQCHRPHGGCRRVYNPSMTTVSEARKFQITTCRSPPHYRTQSY